MVIYYIPRRMYCGVSFVVFSWLHLGLGLVAGPGFGGCFGDSSLLPFLYFHLLPSLLLPSTKFEMDEEGTAHWDGGQVEVARHGM